MRIILILSFINFFARIYSQEIVYSQRSAPGRFNFKICQDSLLFSCSEIYIADTFYQNNKYIDLGFSKRDTSIENYSNLVITRTSLNSNIIKNITLLSHFNSYYFDVNEKGEVFILLNNITEGLYLDNRLILEAPSNNTNIIIKLDQEFRFQKLIKLMNILPVEVIFKCSNGMLLLGGSFNDTLQILDQGYPNKTEKYIYYDAFITGINYELDKIEFFKRFETDYIAEIHGITYKSGFLYYTLKNLGTFLKVNDSLIYQNSSPVTKLSIIGQYPSHHLFWSFQADIGRNDYFKNLFFNQEKQLLIAGFSAGSKVKIGDKEYINNSPNYFPIVIEFQDNGDLINSTQLKDFGSIFPTHIVPFHQSEYLAFFNSYNFIIDLQGNKNQNGLSLCILNESYEIDRIISEQGTLLSGFYGDIEVSNNKYYLAVSNQESFKFLGKVIDENYNSIYANVIVFRFSDLNALKEIMSSQLNVYPNPIKNILTLDKINSSSIIKLYTLNGDEVQVNPIWINDSQLKLDLSNLPNSYYLIKVRTENKIESKIIYKE